MALAPSAAKLLSVSHVSMAFEPGSPIHVLTARGEPGTVRSCKGVTLGDERRQGFPRETVILSV